MANEPEPTPPVAGISRRRLLGAAGIAAGGIAIGGAGVGVVQAVRHDGGSGARASDSDDPGPGVVEFRGPHQAGIATAAQDRMLFAAFDIVATDVAQVAAFMQKWTDAAERLTRGEPVDEPAANGYAPPTDTGEAMGLSPARLTLTFGVGPGLFETDGVDRFGLAAKRPAPLADLPPFPRDELDGSRSGGDLCVQACGDDPQVLFHAVRNLTRIGRGIVVLRWSQEGFGRTSSTTSGQATPRNLMGFKDGTNNVHADRPDFGSIVWAAAGDDPAWMAGGSYLVARRIRIRIEVWDRSSLLDQEATFGRSRDSGAPLGKANEFDAVDLDAKGPTGDPVIAVDAHVRVANQAGTGLSILRRGYNFTDGVDSRTGQLDAGLFFIAYQRDPRFQFVPLQTQLSASDALNEYIQHVGSAVFAVLPGALEGEWLGQSLFA